MKLATIDNGREVYGSVQVDGKTQRMYGEMIWLRLELKGRRLHERWLGPINEDAKKNVWNNK